MYEHRSDPLLSRKQFLRRQAQHAALAGLLILTAWAVGTAGYMFSEQMGFVDAMANAAMILGGMGPLGELHTVGGKIFASFYALLSGVGFIGVTGVLFAPLYHRFLHRFHIELQSESRRGKSPQPS